MEGFIQFLLNSSSMISLVTIVITAIYTSYRVYIRYAGGITLQEIRETEYRATMIPSNLDNLNDFLVKNFEILNSYYLESLTRYRTSSIVSITIAILAFVVIISGILISFMSSKISFGFISGIVGIIGEATALLFFRENKAYRVQMESCLNKLVSTQYLMTSIILARDLTINDKAAEIVRINDNLRRLMNWLHGNSEEQ